MSNANKEARAQYMLDEADVVAFLQQHPEFLQQHPEVLASLELRHDSGTAASLIERQVVLLRDQNRELHARLNGFVETARGNEQRVNQFNTLARALIAAGNTEELVANLDARVRRDMRVEAMFIGLDAAGDTQLPACIHALTADDARSKAVTNVFRRGKPVCGPLSSAQAQALFPDLAPMPASAAMVPLGEQQVGGALVLASHDAEQFLPTMGTLFLEFMGELVTAALRRYLGAEMLP